MNTYTLSALFPSVSRLAYGCMRLGGSWGASPITDEHKRAAYAAIDAARKAGFTLFDHADIYCNGKSETIFGRYLADNPGWRDEIVIQSKCGIRLPNQAAGVPARFDFSRDYILESVAGILRRLGLEQLDVLLLHRPDCLVEPEEVAEAFDLLEQRGQVRAFGLSNHTPLQIALLQRSIRQPLIINQIEISLRHHFPLSDGILANQTEATYSHGIVDYCRVENLRLQAWSPVGGGALLSQERNSSDLALLAAEYGIDSATLALAWLLRHPAGIQPVIGSLQPKRITTAASADQVTISREHWYALLELTRAAPVP